jgi:hypothetical protein
VVKSLDEHNEYVKRARLSTSKLDLAWCLARAIAAYDAEREARIKAERDYVAAKNDILDYQAMAEDVALTLDTLKEQLNGN